MKYEATEKKIYRTYDYDMFKVMDGNRDVKNVRVVRTAESIKEHGWLTQPILCNERFEVIDGQGRLAALKQLGLPVEFVVDKGIGIEECRALNVNQKNWSVADYINSFVAEGNEDYRWLKTMVGKYSSVGFSVAMAACCGCDETRGGAVAEIVKAGRFNAPKGARKDIEKKLFFLSRFTDIAKSIGGRKDKFFGAVGFLYDLDAVDNERLHKCIKTNTYDFVAGGTVESYITQIDIFYNKGLTKARKVDLEHEYKIA